MVSELKSMNKKLEDSAKRIDDYTDNYILISQHIFELIQVLKNSGWANEVLEEPERYRPDLKEIETTLREYTEYLKATAKNYNNTEEGTANNEIRCLFVEKQEEKKRVISKDDSSAIKEITNELRADSDYIRTILNDVGCEMKSQKTYWESGISEVFINRFMGLSDDLEGFYFALGELARFLDSASDVYLATEQHI